MRGRITDVMADILDEHDVATARALLAEAMLADTDTEMATRVSVRAGRPDALLRIHGHGFRPAAELLPRAADIRGHPLYRYRARTGDTRPTRLEDAVRAGCHLGEATRRVFETLRISAHQVELTASPGREYDGWTLIAPSPIGRLQMRPLEEHARLLRGLDSHIELLARMRALAPIAPDAGAPVLTPREQTVLHLMHANCTAAAIGSRLGVSPRTVHKHQENLYRKLGARDRLGAVLVGQRTGLLPSPVAGEEPVAGWAGRV
ncbi:helix-turn-helix transcriptional regulator [Agrococcus sp. SCSIO52902]|uniref:helix-turn-helix transcriptional regulator n=1 Tax=Agrococcus sp. SCSIO52902 TaxID=2933290 RepID=UPI001FF3CD9D|nr:helix-turn-helix transcriptional regulator [Agrococcus sp. SCSIO52902]UOV99759.1 helix-turn-helix transcriptional regulator [Agrococcus sp. SCSIO52902]